MRDVNTLRDRLKKINIRGSLHFEEPMSLHTTFQIGGEADVLFRPVDIEDLAAVQIFAKKEGIPYFLLGRGANILVSDKGIRGIVIDMKAFSGCTVRENNLTALAGTEIDRTLEIALDAGLTGLEFLYGLPGSIGGSVYMNARCYGQSISDRISEVTIIDEEDSLTTLQIFSEEFGYKKSPFQARKVTILSAHFPLNHGIKENIESEMNKNLTDRKEKGHFSAPSAGSVFKNNHSFGEPSGKIIDSLGLKGFSIGGAQIAPYHANIFINTGKATAEDMRTLIYYVQDRVFKEKGLFLEPEILFAGEW